MWCMSDQLGRWESHGTYSRVPDEVRGLWQSEGDWQRGLWWGAAGESSFGLFVSRLFGAFSSFPCVMALAYVLRTLTRWGMVIMVKDCFKRTNSRWLLYASVCLYLQTGWPLTLCEFSTVVPHSCDNDVPFVTRWDTKRLRRCMPWSCWASLRWSSAQTQHSSGRKGISWPSPTAPGLFRWGPQCRHTQPTTVIIT